MLGLAFVAVLFLSLPSSLLADSGACATAGNLVTNCGFETGDFTGWTVVDPTNNTFVATSPFDGFTASSGNFFAALGAVGLNGTVSQTFSTVAGQTYDLSFFLASDGDTPNDFGVAFGSELFGPFPNFPAFGMTPVSLDVTATSSSTTLTFFERDDPGFLGLDDVSVVAATPEPGSLGLLATGLFGMLGWLKKTRK